MQASDWRAIGRLRPARLESFAKRLWRAGAYQHMQTSCGADCSRTVQKRAAVWPARDAGRQAEHVRRPSVRHAQRQHGGRTRAGRQCGLIPRDRSRRISIRSRRNGTRRPAGRPGTTDHARYLTGRWCTCCHYHHYKLASAGRQAGRRRSLAIEGPRARDEQVKRPKPNPSEREMDGARSAWHILDLCFNSSVPPSAMPAPAGHENESALSCTAPCRPMIAIVAASSLVRVCARLPLALGLLFRRPAGRTGVSGSAADNAGRFQRLPGLGRQEQ